MSCEIAWSPTPCVVRQSWTATRSGGRIPRIFPFLRREAKWFAWIVVELLGIRLGRYSAASGRLFAAGPHQLAVCLGLQYWPVSFFQSLRVGYARCFSRARRLALCWFRFCPRPTAYKIMNCAARDLKLAFLHEYPRDLAICPSAPTQFVDQLAVRFQAGARRFLRQAVEDNL